VPRKRSRGGDITRVSAVTPALGQREETFSTRWDVFDTSIKRCFDPFWGVKTSETIDVMLTKLVKWFFFSGSVPDLNDKSGVLG